MIRFVTRRAGALSSDDVAAAQTFATMTAQPDQFVQSIHCGEEICAFVRK